MLTGTWKENLYALFVGVPTVVLVTLLGVGALVGLGLAIRWLVQHVAVVVR